MKSDDTALSNNGLFFNLLSSIPGTVLLLMVVIPLIETIGRRTVGWGIPGATTWVQNATLWIGFFGAVLATIKNRHLIIGTATFFHRSRFTSVINVVSISASATILMSLAWASIILIRYQSESPEMIGGVLPLWLIQTVFPVSFCLIACIMIRTNGSNWKIRSFIVLITILIGSVFIFFPANLHNPLSFIASAVVIILAVFGMPLFVVLGGIGLILFFSADIPIAAFPTETYRILTQPILPSIPLFALTGTILSAGGAPKRLVAVVRAWFGWLPGGAAISTICGCAFFTAITGASGVTILALGSLLLPILLMAKYNERFGVGLLTASGSVGLMFPPSLPVILYGIYGHVAIDQLFIAAFIPGILLVLLLICFSVLKGRSFSNEKVSFNLREALRASWHAKGDLLLPVIIVVGLFSGFMTLIETAAMTALWAVLLETVFHKEIGINKKFWETITETSVLVGALLIVIGLASGLVSYLIDAQVPQAATEWVVKTIQSKWVFLLVLNGMLLLVGAIMDIFSAIVIVVPLIVPIGKAFGVDPVHLGVIFLANLELGYLTPPVGMNLFLSSLRFKKPIHEIWKTVIPFLLIFLFWVILIVYVPALTRIIAR